MNYPGKELEIFDKANFWRNYLFLLIKKFIGKKVLEVGAGIGSFSKIYIKQDVEATLSEIDDFNYHSLKKTFSSKNNIKISNELIENIDETFDTILYLSVLEHIENDKKEIKNALEKLQDGGNLIICVPAHNFMYSNFDREIGHFRRYESNFFNMLDLKNATLKKNYFIDSFGFLLYFFNKIIFSKEVYPSKIKVFVWDKIFIPITYIFDFISFYKLGKNIVCIIQKKINKN
ncbi:class I SAM-dependent methyltransferase [Candidatus Pelagibacter sp.]|nr:class I SAM-dependent methyltransferase [Candidatus Pelagibacter sp.]|tara:strand:- start:198 stop:893 length:696 start_codon:yes stop_codon:yes gene_type:complete